MIKMKKEDVIDDGVDERKHHNFCFSIGEFTSNELEIKDAKIHIYEWGDKSLKKNKVLFSIENTNMVSINLIFMPGRIIWFNQIIPIDNFKLDENNNMSTKKRLSQSHSKLKLKPTIKIRSFWTDMNNKHSKIFFQYSGEQCYDKKHKEWFANINVYHVCIQIKDVHILLDLYNHKITCLVEGNKFEQSYVGRAQQISTNYETGTRVYKWLGSTGLNNQRNFQIANSDDWKEYISDMKLIETIDDNIGIELKSILSYRDTTSMSKMHNFIFDNDEFTNTYKGLPVFIENLSKSIDFKFYNFKYIPPACVSINVTTEELRENVRVLTKKISHIDATMTIYYDDDDDDFKSKSINFFSIILTVHDFLKNLNFPRQIEMMTH